MHGLEIKDGLFLPLLQPEVTGNAAIMLRYGAIMTFPVVIFPGGQPDPAKDALRRNPGQKGPAPDKVDNEIAGVGWDPDPGQRTPSVFFSLVCSSISSEITSFFF